MTQRPNTLDPGHIHTHPCLQMCASTNSGLEIGMCKDTDAHRDRMPRITADMPQAFRSIDSAAVTNSSLRAVTTLLHANSDTGSQRNRHKACFHPDTYHICTCTVVDTQWIHTANQHAHPASLGDCAAFEIQILTLSLHPVALLLAPAPLLPTQQANEQL